MEPSGDRPKHYLEKDIRDASDVDTMLEAYQGALGDRFLVRSVLHRAAAEKYREFGDIRRAADHTLLAEQTRNTEELANLTQHLNGVLEAIRAENHRAEEIAHRVSQRVNDIEHSIENAQRAASRITTSVQDMQGVATRVSNSVGEIQAASRRMSGHSY